MSENNLSTLVQNPADSPDNFMRENKFPAPVKNLADLPDNFRRRAEECLNPDESPQVILMIPPGIYFNIRGRSAWRAPRQVVIFTSRGILHLRERALPNRPPDATYLAGSDLLYMQHSLILLYGRLELVGEVEGRETRIDIEYNTVGQRLLQPALQKFLELADIPVAVANIDGDQNRQLLKKLKAQSLKFMNGLRLYALQPGERLLGYVFQPRIAQRKWNLFNRPIAPASLLALTDRAVILIEEDKMKDASLGWLITICPMACIADIEIQPNGNWRDILLHMARNKVAADRKVTLDIQAASLWQSLWSAEGKTTTGVV